MQITSNDVGQDVEPAWSPDGSSIVFTRNSGGPIDLWIVNVDGSVERQLTRFEDQSSSAPSDPDWSPDGSRIVFAAAAPGAERKDHRDPPRDLWVIDADGTNLTRLTDTPQDEIDPSWSPDGEAIAFLSSSSQVPAGIDLRGPYSPAIVELSSGTIRSLQAPMGSLIDTSLQWLRPGSVDTPEPMPAEVIYIDCTRGDTRISSQTVLIQPDGVHFSVTGLEDAVGVWGSLVTPPGEGTWAFEVDSDHPSRSMVIAPGSYFVACWHEGETDNRFGPQRDGVQLDIIHPGTPLHLEAVAPTLEREKLAGALGLTPHEWTIGQTLEPRREGVYLDGQIPEDCAQQEDDVVIVQQVGDGTFYCARGTDAFQARMMGQRLIGSTPTPQAIRDQRMNEPRPRIGGWPEDVDRDGLISDAGSERIPELIRAAGDGGVSGYIRYEDLEGPQPADPAQAVEISGMPWTIPLYAEDGVTIIDRYTLNAG
jgi:hypothetical protein